MTAFDLASTCSFRYTCISDNWGKSFFFAIPGHFNANYRNLSASYDISLTVTARESGNVTLLAKGENIKAKYSITKGKTSFVVPETVVQSYGQPSIQRKGIRIISTTTISAKLTVTGKHAISSKWNYREKFNGEIYLLPSSTYSTHYTIPFHDGMIGINIVGIKKTGFAITYEKNGERQVIEGKLRKFDSFFLNETFPSGINLISSDKPVAVFSHTEYNSRYNSYQYQYINQISTAKIGRKYIIPSESYHFKAVALNNDTIIEVKRDSRTYNMKLEEGEYFQSMPTEQVVGLSSNRGIIVATYYRDNDYSRPVIAPVTAISQFTNGYLLDGNSYGDLTVVAASNQKDEFIFHERYIPWWIKISYIVMNGTEYFVATARLSAKGDSFRKINLKNQNATFGGFLDKHPFGTCG